MAKNYSDAHCKEYNKKWGEFHQDLLNILHNDYYPLDEEFSKCLEITDPAKRIQKLRNLMEKNCSLEVRLKGLMHENKAFEERFKKLKNRKTSFERQFMEYVDFVQMRRLDPNKCDWINCDEIDEIFNIIIRKDIEIASHICIACQEASLKTYIGRIDIPFFPPESEQKLIIIEKKYKRTKSQPTNNVINNRHSLIYRYQKKYDLYHAAIRVMIEENKAEFKLYEVADHFQGLIDSLEDRTLLNKCAAISASSEPIASEISLVWLAIKLGADLEKPKFGIKKKFNKIYLTMLTLKKKYYKDHQISDDDVYLQLLDSIEKYDPFKTRYLPMDYMILGLVFEMEKSDINYDDNILSSKDQKKESGNYDGIYIDKSQLINDWKLDTAIERFKLEEETFIESIDDRATKYNWDALLQKRGGDLEKFKNILNMTDFQIAQYTYIARYNLKFNITHVVIADWVKINRNTCKYKMETTIPKKLLSAGIEHELVINVFPEYKN